MKHKLHHLGVIILSLLAIVLLNIGFLFLLLGMLPTVMAYLVDETPKKDLYKTVRAANMAGMIPTLLAMMKKSHMDASLQIAMMEPRTWLLVYGCAACGWVLIWVCRWVSYLSLLAAGEARIAQLEAAQKKLVEEWGEDLKEYTISTQ